MATSEALASAAAPASPPAGSDGVGDGDGAGNFVYEPAGGASLAEMDAMMAEGGPAPEDAPAAPAEGEKPAPAPEKPAETPAPEAPADEPGVNATPAAAAEAIKLRKAWAALARDKEAVVQVKNEATAAIERAKSYETKAKDFDAMPERALADPIGLLLSLVPKKTIEEQEEYISAMLDKVIEREKSPVEREIAALKQQIAAREKAETDAREAAKAEQAKAERDRVIANWETTNVGFASSTPENLEKYDLINSLDQGEAVHAACVAYHAKWWPVLPDDQKEKAILSPAQAADAVEAHLRKGAARSKWIKSQFAASPAPAPTVKPAPAPAQPSNGTTAPKRTGTTTLSSVASEGSAPSATGFPDDSDERFQAVLRDMQAGGELPDEWRVTGPSQH